LQNLLLVDAVPGKETGSVIFQLREMTGIGTTVSISDLMKQSGATEAWEVNVLGEKIRRVGGPLDVKPLTTLFLLLQY
jgi:hypothetical protein